MLLIVDQFEELFSYKIERKVQESFLNSFVNLYNNQSLKEDEHSISMVITLRADFLSCTNDFSKFAELINENLEVIGSINNEIALREIIEKPLQSTGVIFEEGLADEILNDALDLPHQSLPLIEFALDELWKNQQDALISFKAYRSMQRILGALNHKANAFYQNLSKSDKELAKDILLRLVTPNEGETGNTKRLVQREWFNSDPAEWRLVQRMAGRHFRIVIITEFEEKEFVEIAHEALLKEWKLLNTWLDEEPEFRKWRSKLHTYIQIWNENDRHDEYLLRGEQLLKALEKEKKRRLSPFEKRYIENSVIYEKRLKSYRYSSLSNHYTNTGNTRFGAILSLEAFSHSHLADDTLPYNKDASRSLYNILGKYIEVQKIESSEDYLSSCLIFSPDGSKIVSDTSKNTIAIWDTNNGEKNFTLEHDASFNISSFTEFSEDGSKILTTSVGELPWAESNHPAHVWDVETGDLIAKIKGEREFVYRAWFIDRHGEKIVTVSPMGMVRIWDLNSQNELNTRSFDSNMRAEKAIISNDRQKLVIFSHLDHGIKFIYLTESNKLIDFKTDANETTTHSLFSPDDNKLLTVSKFLLQSGDEALALSDIDSGHNKKVCLIETGSFSIPRFSPDGKILVSIFKNPTSENQDIRAWDTESGKVLYTITDHDAKINSLQFNHEGNKIISASKDGTARVWDAQTGECLNLLGGHRDSVLNAQFSPDDRLIATRSADGAIRFWKLLIRLPNKTFSKKGASHKYAAFSNDESKILTLSGDVFIWEANKSEPTVISGKDTYFIQSAIFTPDSKKVISTNSVSNPVFHIWDSTTGKELKRINFNIESANKDYTPHPKILDLSPDGKFALIRYSGAKKELYVLDLSKEEIQLSDPVVFKLPLDKDWLGENAWELSHSEVNNAAFSHNGKKIVVSFPNMNNIVVVDFYETISFKEKENTIGPSISKEFIGHQEKVDHVTFCDNDTKILTTSAKDGSVRLWDIDEKGTHAVFSIDSPKMAICKLELQRILISTDNNVAYLYDSSSKKIVAKFDNAVKVAFNPKKRLIAIALKNNHILLADAKDGNILLEFKKHTREITHIVFNKTGSSLVSTSLDNSVIVWPIYDPHELANKIKDLNIMPLSFAEILTITPADNTNIKLRN